MQTVTVLDFDRVLFDTDAFSKRLVEEGIDKVPRGEMLAKAIEEKGIDWGEFVNQEALEYLQTTGDHTIILSSHHSRNRGDNEDDTAGAEWFQHEKIKKSGLGSLAKEVMVTAQSKKARMAEIQERFTDSLIVMVDDEEENIVEAKEFGFETVWFRTPKNLMQPRGMEGYPRHVEGAQAPNFGKFLGSLERYKMEFAKKDQEQE